MAGVRGNASSQGNDDVFTIDEFIHIIYSMEVIRMATTNLNIRTDK